jgi:hypothetical protein
MFQSCSSNMAILRPISTTNDEFRYTCDDTNKIHEPRTHVSNDHYGRRSMMSGYCGGFNILV